MQNDITDIPVIPLGNIVSDALPAALVQPAIRWPYHLPSWNGVDCLWWAMLVRSMYWPDSTWLSRVANWASPVIRAQTVPNANPAIQGFSLVELQDQILVVIPGTSSESEALGYFITHSLRQIYTSQDGWKINQTWAMRGAQVVSAWTVWPPPNPLKPVTVIGHSSGGAYGAYFTYSLYSDAQHPFTLVTYGSPIWGTDSLVDTYRSQNQLPKTIDLVNPNDVVPLLPPQWAAIDLVLPLAYPTAGRVNYRRVNPALQLGQTTPPSQVQQAAALDTVVAAVTSLFTGAGLAAQHSTRAYCDAADLYAANDPSIAANQLTPEYNALKVILNDMNANGPG
jgi:hypothetical protein